MEKKNNETIRFPFSARTVLDEVPDMDEMTLEELKGYLRELEDVLSRLDAAEPKNENSEAYEDWAEEHEDLGDLIDEVLDRIVDLA